jgi:hypothetical protein
MGLSLMGLPRQIVGLKKNADDKSKQISVIRVNPVAKTNQKNNEYSNRFGEPVPGFVTTLVVAPFTIALRTVAADAPGLNCL